MDYNDQFVKKDSGRVKTLKAWRPTRHAEINSAWADYISGVIVPAEKPDLLDDEIRQRVPAPKPAIKIEKLQDGHFLVPEPHHTENQADKTKILRKFLNSEYSK